MIEEEDLMRIERVTEQMIIMLLLFYICRLADSEGWHSISTLLFLLGILVLIRCYPFVFTL